MRLLMIPIVAVTLLAQTPTCAATSWQEASRETEAQHAALEEIEGLTNDLFTLMGTCEAQLPPSLIGTVTWPFSPGSLADATEEQRAWIAPKAAAYAAGKASSRANTLTPEECSRELQALSAKMKTVSESIGS